MTNRQTAGRAGVSLDLDGGNTMWERFNRRSFLQLVSALGFAGAAAQPAEARLGPKQTIEGYVFEKYTYPHKPALLVGPEPDVYYEELGAQGTKDEEFLVRITKDTAFRIKIGNDRPRRAKFTDVEEGDLVEVKGRLIVGYPDNLKASQVLIIRSDPYYT